MDDMKEAIAKLTNVVGNMVKEMRSFETRISSVENGCPQDLLTEMKQKLDSIEGRVLNADDGNYTTALNEPYIESAPLNEADLKETAKLPDCVKELQVFEGNPLHYISWVHSVETILKNYDIVRNKPIYRAILTHIRQKIRGKADSALTSYNIFDENWPEMKRILSLYYADKRDIRTLEHQLNQLTQGNMKMDDFYAQVNHQFSLIINKIKTETYTPETVNALIETYRNRALDVFIRGLNGELSTLLMIKEPKTLPEAYSDCIQIQNIQLRKGSIHTNYSNTVASPVNPHYWSNQRPLTTSKPFNRPPTREQDSWRASPRPFNNPNNSPNRGNNPFANSTPPARVDRFTTSRSANYPARPNFQPPPKRFSHSENLPRKQQRLFHTVTKESHADIPEGAEAEVERAESEQNFMTGSSFPAYHF